MESTTSEVGVGWGEPQFRGGADRAKERPREAVRGSRRGEESEGGKTGRKGGEIWTQLATRSHCRVLKRAVMGQMSVLEKEDGMGLARPAWWNRTWSGGHDEGQHQMLGTGF